MIPKLQDAMFPAASAAVQVTMVVPTANVVVPNEGQLTVAELNVSVAVALLQFITPVGALLEVKAE